MTHHQRAQHIGTIDTRYCGGESPVFYLVLLPDETTIIIGVPHNKSPREVLKKKTNYAFDECLLELIKNRQH